MNQNPRDLLVAALTDPPPERLDRWLRTSGWLRPGTGPDADQLRRYAEMVKREAIHEAGHAVAAWHTGCGVEFAELRQSGDLGGRVRCRAPFGDLRVLSVCVTYAGVAAEYPRFDLAAAIRAAGLEEVDPEVWAELGGDQTSDALADLISHSEVDRAALEKSCLGVDSSFHVPAFGAAQALVWEHWDGVWRFAAELLERGTIHGSDFESVLSGGKARGEPGRESRRSAAEERTFGQTGCSAGGQIGS